MKLIVALVTLISTTFAIADAGPNGSCQSDFGLVPNGGSITGYMSSISSPGLSCSSLIMTAICSNGVLSGPDLYPTCSDSAQDCQGVPDGGSVTGYQSPVGPCISSTVTCTNGELSGPMPFPSCSEE